MAHIGELDIATLRAFLATRANLSAASRARTHTVIASFPWLAEDQRDDSISDASSATTATHPATVRSSARVNVSRGSRSAHAAGLYPKLWPGAHHHPQPPMMTCSRCGRGTGRTPLGGGLSAASTALRLQSDQVLCPTSMGARSGRCANWWRALRAGVRSDRARAFAKPEPRPVPRINAMDAKDRPRRGERRDELGVPRHHLA